jgi:ketosteroid isomerase-like protein
MSAVRRREVDGVVAHADNREVVGLFFAALSDGRYDDARRMLTTDATWWMLSKREYVDPATWFAGFQAFFPRGLAFDIEGLTNEGSRIAVRARAAAVTANGRDFDNAFHFLFDIADNKIAAAWEYGDTLHAERVFRG